MLVVALALLIAAAFMHAGWNYFAKGAVNDVPLQVAYLGVSAVAYLPIAAIALVFFDPILTLAGLGFALASCCIHLAYYTLLGRAYAAGDLSLVYPLARGTGPLLAVMGAIVIFGETPGPLGIAGTLLIVAGILVTSWSGDLASLRGGSTAIAFALATGAMTATYTLWDKEGVQRLSPVLYSYTLDIGRLLMLGPALFALGNVAAMRTVWGAPTQRRAALAIGLLSPGAYLLVLVALRIAPASYVAPAREISVLIGTLLGVRLLGEAAAVRRVTGAAMIVAGIVALTLGQ